MREMTHMLSLGPEDSVAATGVPVMAWAALCSVTAVAATLYLELRHFQS